MTQSTKSRLLFAGQNETKQGERNHIYTSFVLLGALAPQVLYHLRESLDGALRHKYDGAVLGARRAGINIYPGGTSLRAQC